MVKINVSDSGECRVTVRGPWETVKRNLGTAANKVREMARDSREFASITDGTYIPPMKPQNQYRENPQVLRPARQPQINRPVQTEHETGGMGVGLTGGMGVGLRGGAA